MSRYHHFISREGFILSNEEAETLLEEARKEAQQGDEKEGLKLAEKGLSWYKAALKKVDEPNGLVICHLGKGRSLAQIAEILTQLDEWDKALKFFLEAKEDYDKAAEYSEDVDCQVDFVPEEFESIILYDIALAHGKLGNNRKALATATEAYNVFLALGNENGQIDALLVAGISLFYLGDKEGAINVLQSAHELANKSGNQEKASLTKQKLEDIRKEP